MVKLDESVKQEADHLKQVQREHAERKRKERELQEERRALTRKPASKPVSVTVSADTIKQDVRDLEEHISKDVPQKDRSL
jgi:hypothetical protein